jgi:hypothetical protein
LDSHAVAFLKREFIIRVCKQHIPRAALKERDIILDMNSRAVLTNYWC